MANLQVDHTFFADKNKLIEAIQAADSNPSQFRSKKPIHLLKKNATNAKSLIDLSCSVGGPHTILNDPVLCSDCEIPFCRACFDDTIK